MPIEELQKYITITVDTYREQPRLHSYVLPSQISARFYQLLLPYERVPYFPSQFVGWQMNGDAARTSLRRWHVACTMSDQPVPCNQLSTQRRHTFPSGKIDMTGKAMAAATSLRGSSGNTAARRGATPASIDMSAPRAAAPVVELPGDSSEYKFRKQLLLLATLVLSVTYVAGLEPPGGVWKEDGAGGVRAGAPILRSTHKPRYLSFYYCNSAALVASLVVIFLLLLKNPTRVQLAVLRLVMVLDLLALMGAYLAGSCQQRPATMYAASLAAAPQRVTEHDRDEEAEEEDAAPGVLRAKERRKVVLLLATFAVAVTYVAGLNPPGGFWDSAAAHGGYRPGDSLVEAHHKDFLLLQHHRLRRVPLHHREKLGARTARSIPLYVFVLGTLLGLVAAYTAGSCRDTKCSVYVVSLFGAVLAFVFLAMGMVMVLMPLLERLRANTRSNTMLEGGQSDTIDQATKKAGLDPPGGFWPDGRDGHITGDAVLLSKQPARYKAFFYCNSTAFVASVVAIVMVQNVKLVRSHTLLAVTVLDMFALIGASSTSRWAETSSTLPEKEHKHLLLLAILVATITYQVGLTPPSGFWISDNDGPLGHRAGYAVLLESTPRRFKPFFCGWIEEYET
ncbi:hypothetical protein C2845_PM14G08790 [Panicum miliaceum]|uniref:PGG domain-containing protein n=1 Tax=Panicum miliaceum TaxID=4540 RepID=A0A3L6PSS4_PANMI|nr:hypothetical protein C2845_PM14G08790 [Panicum miliaceum]